MLSLYRTLSLRYLRQRLLRATLIVVSIALGVAILVATRVLNQSMSKAATGALTPLSGAADLMIANAESGVPRALAAEIEQAGIAGVRDLSPFVESRVALPDLDNRIVRVIGLPLSRAQAGDNHWGIEVTRLPVNPLMLLGTPAVVGNSIAKALAERNRPTAGVFRARAKGKEFSLATVATFTASPASPIAALGDNLLIVDIEVAASMEFPHRPDLVSRIDLTLDASADREAVVRRIAGIVGSRGDVRTPEAVDQNLRDVTAGLELGLDLGSAGALVVGLFLVYNALAVSVAERRHDIGIMRSLGATRRQVAALFAGEAGILGFVGSILGLPIGIGLARAALGPMSRVFSDIFVPVNAQTVDVRSWNLAVAVAAGVATALLASLVPALQAATEEPADAVRRVPIKRRWAYRIVQAGSSALLIVAGLLCVNMKEHLPLRWGTFGGLVLLFVGALSASPLFAAFLSRLLQPVVRPFLGIEGRLAADNLSNSSGRTGLVIGALAASVGLLIQTAGVTQSSETAMLGWIDRRIAADLFVTAYGPITTGSQTLPMPRKLGTDMEADPELRKVIDKVLPIRLQLIEFRNRPVFLIAFDAQESYDAIRERHAILGQELYPRLHAEPGSALVSENFAALYNVKIGDVVSVRGKNQPVELRVIGTVLDYTWNRGTILIDWPQYQAQFGESDVDLYHVFVRKGVDPLDARAVLTDRWGSRESLVVLTRGQLRAEISEILGRIYFFGYAQESVIGMVAMLGVLTALLISVLQRRRELGLLRAIGATQAQVMRSVLAEALLMGFIGSCIGFLVGIFLEWYVLQVLMLDEAGFIFDALIPWKETALFVVSTLFVSILAGLFPAWQAMRLRIPEAIAYE